MDIKGLVTFIKAGYKAAEIKSIPAADRDLYIDLLSSGVEKENINEYINVLREQENPDNGGGDGGENGGKSGEHEEEKPDYEKLYNDLLKDAQHKETHENIGDDKPSETAYDILKSIIE